MKRAACTHDGVTHVLSIKECHVWAGSQQQVRAEMRHFSLAISLLNEPRRMGNTGSNFKIAKGSGRTLSNLAAYQKSRQSFLAIDWPDMSIPDLPVEFWEALYLDLLKIKGDVVVYCLGGHGRTGTTLAILAHFASVFIGENPDPVAWVREVYCQEAVETGSQIEYLKNVIGIKTEQSAARLYDTGWATPHKREIMDDEPRDSQGRPSLSRSWKNFNQADQG